MSSDALHTGPLQRGLKNRHIQLIALGGAIGTGLFLGSAGVLRSAGRVLAWSVCVSACARRLRALPRVLLARCASEKLQPGRPWNP